MSVTEVRKAGYPPSGVDKGQVRCSAWTVAIFLAVQLAPALQGACGPGSCLRRVRGSSKLFGHRLHEFAVYQSQGPDTVQAGDLESAEDTGGGAPQKASWGLWAGVMGIP